MTDSIIEKITITDPESRSLDLEAQNIEQLKQLFPDVFSEGKVDFEVLKAVLGEHIENNEERYSFTWHGKNKARQIAQTPSTGTLRPCKEESVNWDTTKNLFIEGDNLEVLKLLQKSYHKKIKYICIDPPYNSGNDFIYPDNFKDNLDTYLQYTKQSDDQGKSFSKNTDSSGRFHTRWINMIYPRLRVARNLMADDGFVFIHIDSNELKNMRFICDEIFGEDNHVADIIWKNKTGGGAKTKGLIGLHEYIVIYAKNYSSIEDISVPYSEKTASMYKGKDEHYETRGPFATWPLDTTSMGDRPNLKYPIFHEGVEIWPEKQWLWSRERVEQAQKNNGLVFNKQDSGSFKVRFKGYLKNENGETRRGKPLSIFEGPYSQEGSKDIQKFMPKGVFPFPKPVNLIKSLLAISSKETSIDQATVLDFFAGSGTTAQAVMEYNAENNSNFNFITVQLPEVLDESNKEHKTAIDFCTKNNLKLSISEITKFRIKRVSETFSGTDNDNGFRSFKLDSSNIITWEPDFDNLSDILNNSVDSIKADREPEDVLYEILLKYGLDLTYPITEHKIDNKIIYDVAFGSLIVCLDNGITREVVEGIGKLKQELDSETTRVIFKDAGFSDDSVKVNAIQMLKQYGVDDVKSI